MKSFFLCFSIPDDVASTVNDAIAILRVSSEEDEVNVYFLYFFSTLNLAIDIYCVIIFYSRGREVFYESPPVPQLSLDTSIHSNDSEEFGHLEDEFDGSPDLAVENRRRNLNMISAFTHVGGDTLRTISVFAAAIVSSLFGLPVDRCDAWAAILVSITIVAIVIPLIMDITRVGLNICSDRDGYSLVELEDEASGTSKEKNKLLRP